MIGVIISFHLFIGKYISSLDRTLESGKYFAPLVVVVALP